MLLTRGLGSYLRIRGVLSDPEKGPSSPLSPLSPIQVGRPVLRWMMICVLFVIGVWLLRGMQSDYSQVRSEKEWKARAEQVRAAFVHAMEGYEEYAAHKDGYFDELRPMSKLGTNNLNGWGLTLFDALDTMYLMDLKPSDSAIAHIASSTFSLSPRSYAPFFETVIRYLGGLLSAYALSNHPVLLARADDLGRMLLPAFNSSSGLPRYAVNTVTGDTRMGWSGRVLWAEALSNQVEYSYLAHLTGRSSYYTVSQKPISLMLSFASSNLSSDSGTIFPTMWDVHSGRPSNDDFSVGAFADSAHEYLLKQHLLNPTSTASSPHLTLYLSSMRAILANLLYLSPAPRSLLYVTSLFKRKPTHTQEHLACFLPGLLALGAFTLPADHLPAQEREKHKWAAEGLATTCWATYLDSETGLGADEVFMDVAGPAGNERWLEAYESWIEQDRPGLGPPGTKDVQKVDSKNETGYTNLKPSYLLRPETIESFYILWRTTGNPIWRERSWAIFESIERYTRTEAGYASIRDVDDIPPQFKDEMPSYFLAETLKYLYLLFTTDDLLPFDKWVFNTEAHPLPVFQWKDWERKSYNIL